MIKKTIVRLILGGIIMASCQMPLPPNKGSGNGHSGTPIQLFEPFFLKEDGSIERLDEDKVQTIIGNQDISLVFNQAFDNAEIDRILSRPIGWNRAILGTGYSAPLNIIYRGDYLPYSIPISSSNGNNTDYNVRDMRNAKNFIDIESMTMHSHRTVNFREWQYSYWRALNSDDHNKQEALVFDRNSVHLCSVGLQFSTMTIQGGIIKAEHFESKCLDGNHTLSIEATRYPIRDFPSVGKLINAPKGEKHTTLKTRIIDSIIIKTKNGTKIDFIPTANIDVNIDKVGDNSILTITGFDRLSENSIGFSIGNITFTSQDGSKKVTYALLH